MGIESPQVTLDLLYAARRDLLSGKLANYQLGDRSITLLNLNDLQTIIERYESVILGGTPIYADLSGFANTPPWPQG